MKSEKAKEFIEKYAVGNSRDSAPSMMKKLVIECVELAEQEAEERMRRKAIMAVGLLCEDYSCGYCGATDPYDDHTIECDGDCLRAQKFIQKLNEG